VVALLDTIQLEFCGAILLVVDLLGIGTVSMTLLHFPIRNRLRPFRLEQFWKTRDAAGISVIRNFQF
jgi:hypothetical protein